jgi:hypothetical protein
MSDLLPDRPTDAELRRLFADSVPGPAPNFWPAVHARLSAQPSPNNRPAPNNRPTPNNRPAPNGGRERAVVSLTLPPVHDSARRPAPAAQRGRGWILPAIAAAIVAVALSATAVVRFAPQGAPPADPLPAPTVPSSPTPSASSEVSPTSDPPQVSALQRVTPEQALAAVAPRFDVVGEALPTAYTWTDLAGEHALLLSVAQEPHQGVFELEGKTVDAPTLHAALLTRLDDGYKVDRQLTDPGSRPCGLDLTNHFLPASVKISDTDGDGRGEVTVGWTFGCRGDVAPDDVRLALLEGAHKYILRGTGYTEQGLARQAARDARNSGLEPAPSTFTPDPERGSWPEGAYDHAVDVWNTIAF